MKASQPTPMMTVAATLEPNELMIGRLVRELICVVTVFLTLVRVCWLCEKINT